ncbi:MAG: sterol desaturase family protein [Gammaproteobacteria bacterium]|nr:sterol desaturase family protein [Gammaproteobacteria bacterium]
MDDFIFNNEAVIRLGFFFGVFAVMAVWEVVTPRRSLTQSKGRRWLNNIVLVVLNTVLLRVLFPTAAIGVALTAQQQQWGVLNQLDWPVWLATLVAVIVLDAAIYLQHVMFHAIPAFWRLHRVHHADMDFDVTTGARFHPVEIILSMLIKFAVIVLLGPPLVAVVIFEVLLNATSMFNHGNVRIPRPLDRVLRWLIVTPDMHRVHHSHLEHETNSNFGFNLSLWDRLFGTYRDQPQDGHTDMVIGIDTWRDPAHCIRLPGLLLMPFQGRISGYAINRRSWDTHDES